LSPLTFSVSPPNKLNVKTFPPLHSPFFWFSMPPASFFRSSVSALWASVAASALADFLGAAFHRRLFSWSLLCGETRSRYQLPEHPPRELGPPAVVGFFFPSPTVLKGFSNSPPGSYPFHFRSPFHLTHPFHGFLTSVNGGARGSRGPHKFFSSFASPFFPPFLGKGLSPLDLPDEGFFPPAFFASARIRCWCVL